MTLIEAIMMAASVYGIYQRSKTTPPPTTLAPWERPGVVLGPVSPGPGWTPIYGPSAGGGSQGAGTMDYTGGQSGVIRGWAPPLASAVPAFIAPVEADPFALYSLPEGGCDTGCGLDNEVTSADPIFQPVVETPMSLQPDVYRVPLPRIPDVGGYYPPPPAVPVVPTTVTIASAIPLPPEATDIPYDYARMMELGHQV